MSSHTVPCNVSRTLCAFSCWVLTSFFGGRCLLSPFFRWRNWGSKRFTDIHTINKVARQAGSPNKSLSSSYSCRPSKFCFAQSSLGRMTHVFSHRPIGLVRFPGNQAAHTQDLLFPWKEGNKHGLQLLGNLDSFPWFHFFVMGPHFCKPWVCLMRTLWALNEKQGHKSLANFWSLCLCWLLSTGISFSSSFLTSW